MKYLNFLRNFTSSKHGVDMSDYAALKDRVTTLINITKMLATVVVAQQKEIADLKANPLPPVPLDYDEITIPVDAAIIEGQAAIPAPSTLAIDGLSHPAFS
jgi:hypothetical protein